MESKQNIPYGLWPSPITPAMISRRLRLIDALWDSDGRTLVWLEGRGDRNVLVRQAGADATRDLTGEESVHGGVGYGGGEFTVHKGAVIFAERGGQLFRRSLDYGPARPITPAFGKTASPAVSPDGQWVVYVWSDGVTDLLGLVDAEGASWPQKLVSGASFYMQPAWHPNGQALAWIEWDDPNMPWDGTRLKLAKLAGSPPRIESAATIAGDERTPVQQPLFSPDGRWLSYIDSSGEWERLMLVNLESGQQHTLLQGENYHLALPAWVQGRRSYGWSYDSQRIFSVRNYGGYASLWAINLADGSASQIDTNSYTWITQPSVSPTANEVVFVASAPSIPDRLVRWDGQGLQVVCYSEAESVPPELLPVALPLNWKGADGGEVYGIYYPPVSRDYTASGLPPAIVEIHGGPTGQAATNYSGETAYYTSRGYGWLDVNYRGSTGYGRSYQLALNERWGELDTEDAISGAQALADQHLADGSHLAISGGSAGGYTVLNALIHYPGRFKAGLCSYGVSNLFLLDLETHKFEKYYNVPMIGKLPEAAEKYRAWSPAFHADQIRDPLAVFQGSDDRSVPPNQSAEIVAALMKNGVPHIYKLYEGEGHGFRKPETIADVLQTSERFLLQHVLFAG
jgi:dipeptidyl aminopeptidase/acylaminoacyl peptidase